jgi:hypothetical protein
MEEEWNSGILLMIGRGGSLEAKTLLLDLRQG